MSARRRRASRARARAAATATVAALVLVGPIAASGAGAPRAAASPVPWTPAAPVPGWPSLNHRHGASGLEGDVTAVACPSTGSCVAAGTYQASGVARQAFVVDEVDGRWQSAHEVLGSGSLNLGGDATVLSVSCASAGSCALGGTYTDRHGVVRGFLADEVDGQWQPAFAVPGMASLVRRAHAAGLPATNGVTTVSCPWPGECAAAGAFGYASATDAIGNPTYRGESFVLDEHEGTWGQAHEIPGTGALNEGLGGGATSLSCTAPQTCGLTGYFENRAHVLDSYVDAQDGGAWGRATPIERLASLAAGGGFAQPSMITCWVAGACEVTGSYTDASLCGQTFAAGERDGAWAPATTIDVPGERCSGAPDGTGGALQPTPESGVACATDGTCELSAVEIDGAYDWTLVATETSGAWSPGTRLLYVARPLATTHGSYFIGPVLACAAWYSCIIGGSAWTVSGRTNFETQAATTPEQDGRWLPTVVVPNSIRINAGGDATVTAASCSPGGYCAIAGYYTTKAQAQDAFVSTATL